MAWNSGSEKANECTSERNTHRVFVRERRRERENSDSGNGIMTEIL